MDGIGFVRFKVDNPELAHLQAAQKSGTMMHPCPCASTAHTPVKCRFSTYFIRLLLMSSFRKIARNPFPRVLNFKRSIHDFSSRLHPHTVLFPLDTSIPILSMGIPSFLIKYCNASAPAYYDSNWFVTRTRHSRSNLLNRIFITRGQRTVYSPSAWLTKETVHPLPSHYNKNKHSLRGFIYASGAMLILYQFIEISSFYFDVFGFPYKSSISAVLLA